MLERAVHEVDVDANLRRRGPRDVYELAPMLDAANACPDRRGRDDAELTGTGADVQDVCPRSTTEEPCSTYRDLDRRPMHARHASHGEREHGNRPADRTLTRARDPRSTRRHGEEADGVALGGARGDMEA